VRVAAASALLLLLLPGCALRTAYPQEQGTPWTAWSGPWVESSSGCGFCGGAQAQAAEMALAALDREGRFLLVEYAVGGGRAVTFVDPGLERWRAVVEPLFAPRDHYGQEWAGGQVRVFSVHALELAPADRDRVEAAVARALEDLPEAGPPAFGCADCGGVILKAEGRRAHLGHPPPESGWTALRDQLDALRRWATGTGEAA
jgi:hypothetical protein